VTNASGRSSSVLRTYGPASGPLRVGTVALMSIDTPATLILSETECWNLLGSIALGRLVTSVDGQPEIFPVNFVVQHRSVGRLGVHSALSLPLLLPGQVVGAINVYAHCKDVFDEHAAELGELFAKPAAVAVHNAHVLAQATALTVQLQAALSTRPVIDQAIGLLRGRSGRSAEDAFAQLRAMSQVEHRKLADVAQRIVDEAVRRARARHKPT